jgi:transcriptional regulator with XRE-family HTH domain
METTPYDAEVRHDGRLYAFTLPRLEIPVCKACREKVFTEKVDDQINAALRSHLHLLTPADIRAELERLGLTQKQAADSLGIAEATLSRWLNETQIQSRAMDNLLRVFFKFPEVRAMLQRTSQELARMSRFPDDPDGNVQHCAGHGVTTEEVEEVFQNATDADISRSSGRPVVFGDTSTGRHLMVVYEEIDADTVYPVTAYDVPRRRRP